MKGARNCGRARGVAVAPALFLFAFCLAVFAFMSSRPAFAGCGDPENGLVGWWKLDEGSGTTTADSSGQGNTGTLENGPTWTSGGKVGNALTLSATSSQDVYIPNAPSLDLAGSWTVSTWVKLSSLPASGNIVALIQKSNTASQDNYALYVDNGGFSAGLGWIVNFHDSGGTLHSIKYSATVSTGNWYLVTGTWDGTTESLYLNGASVATGVPGAVPNAAADSGWGLLLGSSQCCGYYASGTIDDARIYNRALSATEVSNLYSAGFAGDMRYNAGWRDTEYCDGGNWVAMGLQQYTAQGVEFDGAASYLTLNGNLAGAADSTKATGSFWFKRAGGTGAVNDIYDMYSNTTMRFELYFDTSNYIHIVGYASSGPTKEVDINGTTAYTADGTWHHVAFTFDDSLTCTTGTSNSAGCQIYVDSTAQNVTVTTFQNTNLIDFSVSSSAKNSIASKYAGGNYYNGALADLWFNPGTYIDLRTASNLAKFYTAAPSGPTYLGATGNAPTGTAPPVFFSGRASSWSAAANNLGTGGAFTVDGTLNDAGNTASTGDYTHGLVGWWKFDDGSSGTTPTTAVDSSGNGNTGTLVGGPTWVAGKINNAISLNGTSQGVDIPGLNLNGTYTFAGWIYVTAAPPVDGWGTLIAQSSSDGIFIAPGNVVAYWDGVIGETASTNPITLNAWHHVAVVDNSGAVAFYLDGVPNGTATGVVGFTAGYLGTDEHNEALPGTLDDVRIYNRALSAADVWALYNQTACAGPAGASGHLMYNADYHVAQFCDGKNWQPMGPVPGAGGSGCSGPGGSEGQVMYSADKHVMQYCDGTNWTAMGGAPAAPEGGLVGWWKFDEGSGSTAADSSGNGNSGTLEGTPLPTWVAGKIGDALNFPDSVHQYVNIPYASSLNATSALSVSAWVKPGTLVTSEAIIFCDANFLEFCLYQDNSTIYFDQSGGETTFDNGSTLAVGTWIFLTGTWDGRTMDLYENGSLVKSVSYSHSMPTGSDLGIGGTGEAYYKGTIDDVRLYNRALSAAEVWDLYLTTGGT